MPDYRSYHGQIEDLLILEGRCVVPTAISAINNKALFKRPFILSFLGNGAFREALDPLVRIVEDETDVDRSPAIIAVFRIDNEKGRELARRFETEDSKLGEHARDILANEDYLYERKSCLEAWRSYIDTTYAL